jgi:uncharacterized protein YdcH (DUF465 family)
MKKPMKKRVVKIVRHSFEGGIEQLLDIVKGQNEKIKELVAKHNEMAEKLVETEKRQQQIAIFSAQEFGKLMAQNQHVATSFANSIEHIDLNVLATAEVLKELFGQLTQVDRFIKKVANGTDLDLTEAELTEVKTEAEGWFKDTVASAFKAVLEKREAEDKARLAELERAKKEAEVAAKATVEAKTEAETVEKALGDAAIQERGIQTVAGGPGADIPEGASVFGG